MAARGKVTNGDTVVEADCLNAVRALHQTVVCLRTALERSQNELHSLKSKVQTQTSTLKYDDTIEQLSLENHVLRRKILSIRGKQNRSSMEDAYKEPEAADLQESEEPPPPPNEETAEDTHSSSLYRNKTDSEESEEVDDIELIFTTEETRGISLQEELERISDDECGDTYESKSEVNPSPGIVTQSVLVETDISKCGVVYENDPSLLSPVPHAPFRKPEKRFGKALHAPLKPLLHPARPSLHENASSVRDSEAQTDISAVPPHWKSESFLANNKAYQNLPTLPSKFAIPVKQGGPPKAPLRLTEKTQEARRILLSDINFTSMVPELSRSVDHLCQNGVRLPNTAQQSSPFAMKYLKSPALLSSGSSYSRFEFNVGNSSWNCYENSYASEQEEKSTQDLHTKRRQSWRPSMYSLDAYYSSNTSSVPPSPTLRRHSAALSYSPSSNVDAHFYYPLPDKFNMRNVSTSTLKNTSTTSISRKPKSRVSFKESLLSKNSGSRQSLPNMYVDTESGEESTDSLIDESEECVRKSIETTLTNIDWPYVGYRYVGRTYSVPNLFLEFSPPLSARPFIARSAGDLKPNYFVKVINKDGRVVGGRIQFVGNVTDKTEPYIGLLLPPNMGESDGSFQGIKYFTCDKNCGLFVPFRKVVMAWRI